MKLVDESSILVKMCEDAALPRDGVNLIISLKIRIFILIKKETTLVPIIAKYILGGSPYYYSHSAHRNVSDNIFWTSIIYTIFPSLVSALK